MKKNDLYLKRILNWFMNLFRHKEGEKKMEFNYVYSIISKHNQIHVGTCTPSAVEMILKLENRVNGSYYDLQNDPKFLDGANYSEVVGERHGLTFKQQYSYARNEEFDIEGLFSTIENELINSKYVAISLYEGINEHGNPCYHNYIIFDNKENEFQAVTRFFNNSQPYFENSVKKRVKKMYGTDILTYEK